MKQHRIFTLFPALWDRTKRIFNLKWKRVHWGDEMRRHLYISYAICGVIATYSVIHLAYEINIDFLAIIKLPIQEFYTKQIVPFISSPLKWVELRPGPIYKSLLVFSGVGAYIWSNAEFNYNQYLLLYFFPSKQQRPGELRFFDKIDWETAGKPEKPPKFFWKGFTKLIIRLAYKLILMYTLLGLICIIVGFFSGIQKLIMYLYELFLFILSQIVFPVQYLLAPIERWGQDDYWGTRLFLAVYNFRKKIDNKLEGRLQRLTIIPQKQIGTIYPIANGIIVQSGRIAALTMIIVIVIWLLQQK
jgi:hypothetical protein